MAALGALAWACRSRRLRRRSWRIVVGGNSPQAFQRLVEELDLPVDVVTSSGELGVEKPSKAFFARIAAVAGCGLSSARRWAPRRQRHRCSTGAGRTVVHLRRGPWGVLHAADRALEGAPQLCTLAHLPELLGLLRN